MTPAPQQSASTTPLALTEIEQQILDYMVEFLRANTYQPSIRDIAQRFGIRSTKTVSEYLQSLADKGYLERDPSRSRGVRILGMELNARTVSVPCYGELPNGARPGEQLETRILLDPQLTDSRGAFFVRVRGDELAVLGISDGDLILVEPVFASDLADGDVVAASARGTSVVRRFYRREGKLVLDLGHPMYEPIIVDEGEEFVLLGRVAALYRRFAGVPAAVGATAH
ncbi:MAG: repressor LexA [Gemmatimonadetes bacterium]|nr:repressor LexA [Gemmatimonadota bacterium]